MLPRAVILKRVERWLAVRIEGDDFTVDHRFVGHGRERLRDARITHVKSLSLRERNWTLPPLLMARAR